jgi:hypothetical protein
MDVSKPYKFIGLGTMDVNKPSKFIGCWCPGWGIESFSSVLAPGPRSGAIAGSSCAWRCASPESYRPGLAHVFSLVPWGRLSFRVSDRGLG